jgi:hypothetical protein
LALLLACRLLAPAGFMPSFDHGAITIVACPDAELAAPTMLGHHQHGRSKTQHQPCPYASASGLSSIAAVFAPLVSLLILAAALVLGRTYLFLELSRHTDEGRQEASMFGANFRPKPALGHPF